MQRIEANGASIPAIGLGTWTLDDAAAEGIVAAALRGGWRHVDTAAMYGNEAGVGAGLRAAGVPRGEVFVTTKVWPDQLSDGALQASAKRSLAKLRLDAVDLLLVHWPSKTIPLAETMGALADAQAQGLARHVGVSNFTTALLAEAARLCPAPLVANQIECHPELDQRRVIAANDAAGLATVAYCPLARGAGFFEEPAVAGPARRLGVSPAQVVLRWHVQQGRAAIPRTSNPARLAQNLDVFGFALDESEMAALSALGARGRRICDFDLSPAWDAA